jgi:small subunit ribosomal protein S7
MPRSGLTSKLKIAPDEKYSDLRIAKFVNYVMLDGKKDKAKKIVYDALDKAAKKVGAEPLAVFDKAINVVKPDLEVRSRRVGGATYQIPNPVPKTRGEFLAMTWIIQAARSRKGKGMVDKLADEIMNAFNEQGDAVKKRENTHRMAEANRAFAHFKW